jgi:pyruvate,water dikinase
MTGPELIAYGERVQAVFTASVRRFLFAAFGIWDTALAQLIGRWLPGRGQAVAAGLMAGSGGVVSAEHGYRVWELAGVAAADPDARRYLESEPLDPKGWQELPASSAFRQAFAGFLAEYGHRGVYELDTANPRWVEEPGYLLGEVRRMLDQDRSRHPRETARAVRRAAEAEMARLPLLACLAVRWLAARARRAAARREEGKAIIATVTFAARRTALEVGRRLVATGRLDDAASVFYLAQPDYLAYLRGEWDGQGAAALAADRRAQQAVWERESPPDVIVLDAEGSPASMPAVAQTAPEPRRSRIRRSARPSEYPAPEGWTVLSGTAAAPGHATGPARIIRHPTEGARLGLGEILVAPSTDPAWTPLFLRASAIATAVGGYHSHGAIVAREYGIPAVVNVPDLLSAVADGQPISVDGGAGRVAIAPAAGAQIDEASSPAAISTQARSARA